MLKYKYSNKIDVQKDIDSGLVVRLDEYISLKSLFSYFKEVNYYYGGMYYNLYFPFILSDPDILNSSYRVYLCNGENMIISNDRSKINSIDSEDNIINTAISDINNRNISFGISNIRLYSSELMLIYGIRGNLSINSFNYNITLYSYSSNFVTGLRNVCSLASKRSARDNDQALIEFDLELPYGTKYTDLKILYREEYKKDHIYSNNKYLFNTIMTNRDRLILVSMLANQIQCGDYELKI